MTELTKPKPSMRTQMYRLLRASKGTPLSRQDMATKFNVKNCDIDGRYLKYLETAAIAEKLDCDGTVKWQLKRDYGVDTPRFTNTGELIKQTGVNEAVWRAMRILKKFTRAELLAHVSKYTTESSLRSYIKALRAAGYLQGDDKTHAPTVYRLVKNTGPQPPQILRVKEVYDPNIDQIVLREVPEYE